MAKRKKEQAERNRARRESKNEQRSYMLNQKEQQQYKIIRLGIFGLVGLIGLVLLGGLGFEYGVKPRQPVAEVNGTEIAMSEWQERTTFERHRAIAQLDDFYDAVGGDLNQLQQYAGYQMQALQIPAVLGRQILDQMIDEKILEDEAAGRSITVSDEEIDALIEERFNFYDGELPPATEVPTETPEPTPSVTPISDIAETDTLTPTATFEPTEEPTPAPTQTPVSQDSFDEEYSNVLNDYSVWGGSEETYRNEARLSLLSEKLRDSFSEEGDLTLEEERYSLFSMLFYSEEDAAEAKANADANGILPVWNEIRSAERLTQTQPFASEVQWTGFETISRSFGAETAEFVQTATVDATSDVLASDDSERWYVLNLRGREMQPLTDAELDSQKSEILSEWLADERDTALIYQSRYEDNSPTKPFLPSRFYRAAPAEEAPVEIQE